MNIKHEADYLKVTKKIVGVMDWVVNH